MATAPFPFYYSPPYAYPSAVTYPPPAFGVFTAPPSFASPIPTQYDPNRLAPAATPIHGDLHNYSPPFFYSAPPSFPYPPPASAYTPASGFSPNWPTWPPPSPDPTPSTAPPSFSSFSTPTFAIPTTTPNLFGDPAAVSFPAPAYGSSDVPPADFPSTAVHLLVQGTPQPAAAPATPNRSSMVSSSSASAHSPITQVDADGSIPTEMEFVLTELRGACSLKPRPSPASTASTPTFASVSATSSSEVLSAMNSVAPQVFGEKPTPIYLHGTQATTLNCCDGHQNLMRSPYVQERSTNLHEQYIDEVPKSYGFNNLSSQSLFLADGTERHYFALPEDYPLEQVTPPMSYSAVEKVGVTAMPSVAAQAADLAPGLCSKANSTADFESMLVHKLQAPTTMQDTSSVFTEMSVYDIYEEDNSCLNCMDEQLVKPFHKAENAFSEQLLKCIIKALETGKRIACLNYSSHLFDFTLELQQQDDEKSNNCSVLPIDENAPTNVLQQRVPQLSLLGVHERRREWDPGDIVDVLHTSILAEETSTHLTECNSLEYLLQSAEFRHPSILSYFFILRYYSVKCNSWLDTIIQYMCDQVEGLNPLSLSTPWT